jgi:hypothetical protein
MKLEKWDHLRVMIIYISYGGKARPHRIHNISKEDRGFGVACGRQKAKRIGGAQECIYGRSWPDLELIAAAKPVVVSMQISRFHARGICHWSCVSSKPKQRIVVYLLSLSFESFPECDCPAFKLFSLFLKGKATLWYLPQAVPVC